MIYICIVTAEIFFIYDRVRREFYTNLYDDISYLYVVNEPRN